MNKIDLGGQVAVVTGGAQGIGLAIARRLVQSGDYAALARAMEELSMNARSEQADVTDLAALQRAHASTEAELGPVSILVNSAGIAGKNATLEDSIQSNGGASSTSISPAPSTPIRLSFPR